MSIAAWLHLVLHLLVPLAVARLLAPAGWRRAWLLMMLTMVVDLDHLWATPLYDPERCSVTYHPLHRGWTWPLYGLLALWPRARWLGLGLLIHMALDTVDCARQSPERLVSEFFRIW